MHRKAEEASEGRRGVGSRSRVRDGKAWRKGVPLTITPPPGKHRLDASVSEPTGTYPPCQLKLVALFFSGLSPGFQCPLLKAQNNETIRKFEKRNFIQAFREALVISASRCAQIVAAEGVGNDGVLRRAQVAGLYTAEGRLEAEGRLLAD